MLSKDAKVRPSIRKILGLPFLQAQSKAANEKYALGLDLSEFEAAAALAAPAASSSAPVEELGDEGEENKCNADYESSDDEGDNQVSELQRTVTNLKLGPGNGTTAPTNNLAAVD